MTKKSKEQYQPNICPVCKSKEFYIDNYFSYPDEFTIREQANCLECEAHWTIEYKFNNIIDILQEKKV